jgi:hypothetical protein
VWTDICLGTSIACLECDLICVGVGEEQATKVYVEWRLRSGETSRLSSRGPMVDRIECGSHSGKNGRGNMYKEPVQGSS